MQKLKISEENKIFNLKVQNVGSNKQSSIIEAVG